LISSVLFGGVRPTWAQKQEVGLTLGGLLPSDHTSASTSFTLGSGIALQADYEYRIWSANTFSLYIGAHFLASPQRTIDSRNPGLTHDIASLYVTPGIMVKFFPLRRVIPWASIGGGYGDYEQSRTTLNGQPNPAPRQLGRGVLQFGGGVDVPVWRFVALRGEVRDFYTGSAAFNTPYSGGQHNVVVGGGFVLRFGGR
jgi:hypothetical protein